MSARCALLFAALALPALAEDRLELEGTSVIGNQELPKVLYVVPWKEAQVPEPESWAMQGLLDEALAPIEREEFKRRIDYYYVLHGEPQSR